MNEAVLIYHAAVNGYFGNTREKRKVKLAEIHSKREEMRERSELREEEEEIREAKGE